MLRLYFNQGYLLEYVLNYSFQKVNQTAYFWKHQGKLFHMPYTQQANTHSFQEKL